MSALDATTRVLLARPAPNLPNLFPNLWLAWRAIRELDADVIRSTGAGPAVPFFVAGRLLGKRRVCVESLSRVHGLALRGRLVYPIADALFVQCVQAARRLRAWYRGSAP